MKSGFSIIELMVTVSVGMIILLLVIDQLIQSTRIYRNHQAVLQLQTGARAVLEQFSTELKASGSHGCFNRAEIFADLNVELLKYDPAESVTTGSLPESINRLLGFRLNSSLPAPTTPVPANYQHVRDSFAIVGKSQEPKLYIGFSANNPSHGNSTYSRDRRFTYSISSTTTIEDHHQYLSLSNNTCTRSLLVQVEGSGASKIIKGELNIPIPPAAQLTQTELQDFKRAVPLNAHLYFLNDIDDVVDSDDGLYQVPLISSSAASSSSTTHRDTRSRTLVSKFVNNMHVLYGISAQDDTVVVRYVDANQLNNSDDWDTVRAVKIFLLMRSDREVHSEPRDYPLIYFPHKLQTTRAYYEYVSTTVLRNQ